MVFWGCFSHYLAYVLSFYLSCPKYAFLLSFLSPHFVSFCSCRIRSCMFLHPPLMRGSGGTVGYSTRYWLFILYYKGSCHFRIIAEADLKNSSSIVPVLLSAYVILSLMFDIMEKMQRSTFSFQLRLCKSKKDTGAKRGRMQGRHDYSFLTV